MRWVMCRDVATSGVCGAGRRGGGAAAGECGRAGGAEAGEGRPPSLRGKFTKLVFLQSYT